MAKYTEANKVLTQLKLVSNNDLKTIIFVCQLEEMQNELTIDSAYFSEALLNNADNIPLLLLKAQCLINSNNYQQAINLLDKVIHNETDKKLLTDSYYKNGNAYDKLQKYDQAWASFIKANKIVLESQTQTNAFNSKLTNLIKQIDTIKPVTFQDTEDLDFKVIFIVGFPRSGTTPMDSILSCNESTIVLEEVQLIDDIVNNILESTTFENYYDYLTNIDENKRQELRSLYIENINYYHHWNNNEVIIDKSPLNLIHTLLIHILFPTAPIIFAVRHPYDVCISCYMQNFRSNGELINNFSSEESIAETYNNLLTLWDKTLSVTKINYYYLYYENLTSDYEINVKKLIKFVNFNWNKKYLEFYLHTKSRGMIHTPSYNQVNKPIYKNQRFRFTNYINNIGVFTKKLSTWLKYFKYTHTD